MLLTYTQFKVLRGIEGYGYMHEISKRANVTYGHVFKIMNDFVSLGLVLKGKINGRICKVSLTDKGVRVLDLYLEVYQLLK